MTDPVIFVSDYYVNELVGGAELTTEALIQSSPFPVVRLKSNEITMEILEKYHTNHWIFGNWVMIDFNLIPTIIANMTYSILEYDYKLCQYRSPEKHKLVTGSDCDCVDSNWGKLVGAFFLGAKTIWWMSERQQQRYLQSYPDLANRHQSVLSSVFSEDFWVKLQELKDNPVAERSGWLVLGSSSWIKGTQQATKWCEDNDKQYKVLQGLTPDQVLEEMSKAEGFVYLPEGGDTCPRVVIEAKLLGCQLHINEHVEHATEDWFTSSDPLDTESYLYAARETFWNGVKHAINWQPTISGYTTTRNCITQKYPFDATIFSLLGFCDEVIVVDAGSTDGTWEKLQDMAAANEKLKVHQVDWDYDNPRFAVYDGALKAEARSHCTMEFCWQMDSDEMVKPEDWQKIKNLCKTLTPEVDLVSLPVIEYWGSTEKVRMDITPWKWRLSRNKPYITHGIPAQFRQTDENGQLFAKPGTDGCDYIHKETHQVIPHVGFYTEKAHYARMAALEGDETALEHYGIWFKAITQNFPSVHHFSWYDIERKIKTYRDYWQKHWESLYNIRQEDTAENNMFFDKPWSEVDDVEIKELAQRLADELGGHIFHTKVDWSKKTPWLVLNE